MRTLDLLKALSDTELKTVERSLSGGKREALLKLFKELKKYISTEEEPTHDVLFEKVTGEVYSKDKDYLLRNRMRQLNDIIYNHMVMESFRDHLTENPHGFNYWLARSYYNRKAKGLFEADINEFIAAAKASMKGHPEYSLPLHYLLNQWFVIHGRRMPKDIEAHLALMEAQKSEEARRALYSMRILEGQLALVEKIRLQVNGLTDESAISAPRIDIIDLAKAQEGDWYARYLDLTRLTFVTKGAERIKLLQEKHKLYAIPEYLAELGPKGMLANLNNLASEYVRTGDYTKALDSLTMMVSKYEEWKVAIPAVTIQLYLLCHLQTGQYKNGLQLYKKYIKEIRGGPYPETTAQLAAYLHLFLEDEDKAIRQLPELSRLLPSHQIHHRYAYLISFLIRGTHELASNELFNLKRLIRTLPGKEKENQVAIAALFDSYIKAQAGSSQSRAKALSALKNKILDDYQSWNTLATTELPLRWLMVKLQIAPK